MPAAILQPVNRLTVRVADSLDAEIPRGKQQSRVYKQGVIWYQTINGAVRSVWLEPVERNRLRSRLNVTSSLADRVVEFDLTTRTHDPSVYTLQLTVNPHYKDGNHNNEPLAVARFTLPLDASYSFN